MRVEPWCDRKPREIVGDRPTVRDPGVGTIIDGALRPLVADEWQASLLCGVDAPGVPDGGSA